MAKHVVLFIIFIVCYNFSNSQDNKFSPEYRVILNSDSGKDLLDQCSRSTPERVKEFWNPNESDIAILELNFKKVLTIKAVGCCIKGLALQSLEETAFQYLGILIKNKKYIYINAFSFGSESSLTEFYKKWKTQPIKVCDGGSSYWGVLFDLEKLEFSQLSFNGIV